MKSIFICLSIAFCALTASAQTVKKETIKVWGNCGMCKTTIEKAAKSAGAKTAVWNEDTKQLEVAYTASKTSSEKIQQAIASSGYDTQDFSADNKAYDKLHGCCKYDRKSETAAAKCCDNTSCGKSADACKDEAACKDKSCCKKS